MQIVWNVSQLDCLPDSDGRQDYVITAHWQCNGVDGEYSGSVYSTTGFAVTEGESFTAYADLSQQQVLEWVWASGVDKDATEAAVAQQIENQKNPPVVSPKLPWAICWSV